MAASGEAKENPSGFWCTLALSRYPSVDLPIVSHPQVCAYGTLASTTVLLAPGTASMAAIALAPPPVTCATSCVGVSWMSDTRDSAEECALFFGAAILL
eukprot:CAMPEP_0205958590 /NCGR_PEP_ID=MMETSP1459-20131121/51101_1 /ASSEMBLY_ACC=CAM_ASM_001120 /TAXON_ID=41880 /ORGANISM="Pycnococcus provasolii, Strain RCC931" /LENGTH=98 /DNA_ID=CAMNT_0053331133 /DNA_START=33 /DNA_END=329 /DNA_ORIENTATION=-